MPTDNESVLCTSASLTASMWDGRQARPTPKCRQNTSEQSMFALFGHCMLTHGDRYKYSTYKHIIKSLSLS